MKRWKEAGCLGRGDGWCHETPMHMATCSKISTYTQRSSEWITSPLVVWMTCSVKNIAYVWDSNRSTKFQVCLATWIRSTMNWDEVTTIAVEQLKVNWETLKTLSHFSPFFAAHKVNLGQDYSNQDIRVNFSARLPMPVLFGDLVLFQAGRIRLGMHRPRLDFCKFCGTQTGFEEFTLRIWIGTLNA